ncbi:hypothetical protein [Nonomuraea sp. 10N515B]|uniref:hypothetical protein n=1 Tax=Nonomuraea sp. 10N515B TaxID=3457422 RepID=UPI003FCE8F56
MSTIPPARKSGRSWALLLVLCGTIFLEGSDVAMLAVAIPTIRTDLGLTTGTATWVMSGYVLGYAGFTGFLVLFLEAATCQRHRPPAETIAVAQRAADAPC